MNLDSQPQDAVVRQSMFGVGFLKVLFGDTMVNYKRTRAAVREGKIGVSYLVRGWLGDNFVVVDETRRLLCIDGEIVGFDAVRKLQHHSGGGVDKLEIVLASGANPTPQPRAQQRGKAEGGLRAPLQLAGVQQLIPARPDFCGRVRPHAGARDRKHGRTGPCGSTLLLSAMLLATGCQVRTDPYGRTVLSTPTLGKALGLAPQTVGQPQTPAGFRQARPLSITSVAATDAVQDQRTVGRHTVQIVAAQGGHRIVVDGRVVATDVQDDRVLIQGVHQGGGRTYVLIAEQSGGNACPSLYQAVDLSGRAPVVSPRFGNCSDVPRIAVVGGALRVAIPVFRAAPAATYVFQDGHLKQQAGSP